MPPRLVIPLKSASSILGCNKKIIAFSKSMMICAPPSELSLWDISLFPPPGHWVGSKEISTLLDPV